MKTYKSLKGKYVNHEGTIKGSTFIYRGQKLKRGQVVQSETEPIDGKGHSLVNCEFPNDPACKRNKERGKPCKHMAFELISDDSPARNLDLETYSSEIDETKDPRKQPEIRRDIKERFGEPTPQTMKKKDLLALERKLIMLEGKEGTQATGTNDAMTPQQAQNHLHGR